MKTTTAEKDPQAVAKLRELIEDIAVAMLITVSPDGVLRSRPMLTLDPRKEGELWFFTSDDSHIAGDLAEEHAVNVSYADATGDRYVSVSGLADLVTDRAKLRELWQPALTRFFPKGLDDPHLALLRVRIETAEYWDASASKMVPLRELLDGHHTEAAADTKSSPHRDGSENGDGGEHTKVEIRATPASG